MEKVTLCRGCWDNFNPDRQPVVVKGAPLERCEMCSALTGSGIYVTKAAFVTLGEVGDGQHVGDPESDMGKRAVRVGTIISLLAKAMVTKNKRHRFKAGLLAKKEPDPQLSLLVVADVLLKLINSLGAVAIAAEHNLSDEEAVQRFADEKLVTMIEGGFRLEADLYDKQLKGEEPSE